MVKIAVKLYNIWILLGLYVFLVLLDVGINLLAILIPSLGGVAESFSEGIIELFSGIIVLMLAFGRGK